MCFAVGGATRPGRRDTGRGSGMNTSLQRGAGEGGRTRGAGIGTIIHQLFIVTSMLTISVTLAGMYST